MTAPPLGLHLRWAPFSSLPRPPLPQWPTHKSACKSSVAISVLPPPSLASLLGSREAAPYLAPGTQIGPAVRPSELASLIRTFLAAGDGRRASGIEAETPLNASERRRLGTLSTQFQRLDVVARASVADALAVVSAEGFLRRVERTLAVPALGDVGMFLATSSIAI